MKADLIHSIKERISFDGFTYPAHLAAVGYDSDLLVLSNPLDAIYGFATAANFKVMHDFMDKSDDKASAVKMAIRGLARGKHLDELYKMNDYKAHKEDIVFGFAQADDEARVDILVRRDPLMLKAAIRGYASTGNTTILLPILVGTRFYGEAIYEAALAGHVDLVNQLLATCGYTEDMSLVLSSKSTTEAVNLSLLINKALSGYCKGYHFEHAAHLLARGANIQIALDELKRQNKPCLNAYIALFIAASGGVSEALLAQIQLELSLTEAGPLSSEQIDNMNILQAEYRRSGVSLVTFLTQLSSTTGLNVLEQLDTSLDSTTVESKVK